jgi:hypothetical protein
VQHLIPEESIALRLPNITFLPFEPDKAPILISSTIFDGKRTLHPACEAQERKRERGKRSPSPTSSDDQNTMALRCYRGAHLYHLKYACQLQMLILSVLQGLHQRAGSVSIRTEKCLAKIFNSHRMNNYITAPIPTLILPGWVERSLLKKSVYIVNSGEG